MPAVLSKAVKKIAAGAMLGVGFVTAVGVGSWQIAVNSKQTAVVQAASSAAGTPDNPVTNYKIKPEENPGSAYGDSSISRNTLRFYNYQLVGRFAQIEQSRYSMEAVEEQVRDALAGLNSALVPFDASLTNAVYNFVQAFNENNSEGIVAWRTTQTRTDPAKPERAVIFMEGGPLTDAASNAFFTYQRINSWRTFYLNQAQFGIVPRQMVGSRGARAAGNYFFDKLRSTDKAKLATVKDAYDSAQLADSALLAVISGNLDLSWTQVRVASGLAAGIVNSARAYALTQQLHASNYASVSMLGISYGMPAGLMALLFNPELADLLYKISLGENSVAEPTIGDRYKDNPLQLDLTWDTNFYDLRALVDMRPWLNRLLDGPRGSAIRAKMTVHNAKDDQVLPADVWIEEQKYWESKNVDYHLYDTGGHGVFRQDDAGIAALSGLQTGQTMYIENPKLFGFRTETRLEYEMAEKSN